MMIRGMMMMMMTKYNFVQLEKTRLRYLHSYTAATKYVF